MRLVFLLAAAIVSAAPTSPVLAAPSEPTPRVNLSGLAADTAHQRFIVQFRQGTAAFDDAAQRQAVLDRAAGAMGITLTQVRRLAIGADVIRADRALDPTEAEALMRALGGDPAVEYIEVDSRHDPVGHPNDPSFGDQWSLGSESPYAAHVDRAWDFATGEGVVVAVLDSGITAHVELVDNLLHGYDFIDDLDIAADGDGRDADPADQGVAVAAGECGAGKPAKSSDWHGTAVAGVIAAATNNATGIAGVAPAAKIVPVRILGKCGGLQSDLVDAIVWAAGGAVPGVPANAYPADVVNLSTVTPVACTNAMQRAIDFAVGRGATLVAAAGNDAKDVAAFSPGSCNNVITVTSSNHYGAPAKHSNHGAPVDIAAPGTGIQVLSNTGTDRAVADTYANRAGTSFATPLVAGVVALMHSRSPGALSPALVEAALKRNATPFATAPANAYGAGIVDAGRVLEETTRTQSAIWEAILGVGPPKF